MRSLVLLGAVAASIVGAASARAAVSDLGPGSPFSSAVTGLTGPLAFSPAPAAAIKEVTGKTDMKTYFPNQNPDTVAAGVEALFGLASGSLTLTLNDEHPTASPFVVSDPAGFAYVAIHNGTGELVFAYATAETAFRLSGYGDAFSNARFFSAGGSPIPEPSTWAMLALGFACVALAGTRAARTAASASAPISRGA